MTDRSEPLGLTLAAGACGFGGIAAFLAGWDWLGWIGMGGFVLILIWMILTQPAQYDRAKGKGGSAGFWGYGGVDGDGGGGGGGGDG